jgi:hypothetical protein
MKIKNVLVLIALLAGMLLPASVMAGDSIRVSLLTCEPGQEVYEQYGHTAIRYEDPSRGYDIVFNYGMFSFRTPNFVWRFIKGETDYQLGIAPFPYFEAEYASRGSSVYQQELNLTLQEKQRLYDLLEENYRPANRTYRYNFFYDNCTTRARDIVERAIEGTVIYGIEEESDSTAAAPTFRDIVHEHTTQTPWTRFGIDLLLGAEADAEIGQRERQFAPFHYLRDVRKAFIQRGGEVRPLLLRESMAVTVHHSPAEKDASPAPNQPFHAAMLFLIIYIGIALCALRTRRIFWGADLLLYTVQGLAGCIIALLFFGSTHPTVGSNWLILLFNPLPMLYLPWMIRKALKGQKDRFHGYYSIYLTIFIIIMPLLPQKFDVTIVPLALSLWVNSMSHIWVYRLKERA